MSHRECNYGAGRGNRTPTVSPQTDFESAASTSSAIPAKRRIMRQSAPLVEPVPGPGFPPAGGRLLYVWLFPDGLQAF